MESRRNITGVYITECGHYTLHKSVERLMRTERRERAPVNIKVHQRERRFKRRQGWPLKHWLYWLTILILPMAVQTKKIPIKSSSSNSTIESYRTAEYETDES
jgi:hypothetical protein